MAMSVDQLIELLDTLPGHAQVRLFADPDEPRGYAAESVAVRSDFDQETYTLCTQRDGAKKAAQGVQIEICGQHAEQFVGAR